MSKLTKKTARLAVFLHILIIFLIIDGYRMVLQSFHFPIKTNNEHHNIFDSNVRSASSAESESLFADHLLSPVVQTSCYSRL